METVREGASAYSILIVSWALARNPEVSVAETRTV